MNFVFRHDDVGYFKDERRVKKLINTNRIKDCLKLPLVKVGDFVTCCHVKDSLNPNRNKTSYKWGSWKENKVILVTSVIIDEVYKIVGDNTNSPINTSGVRFSTEKEIEDYKINGI